MSIYLYISDEILLGMEGNYTIPIKIVMYNGQISIWKIACLLKIEFQKIWMWNNGILEIAKLVKKNINPIHLIYEGLVHWYCNF